MRNRFATIFIEFIPRRARKPRAAVQGSRPSLVILQGWNHPDPPDALAPRGDHSADAPYHAFESRWPLFAPEWQAEFDAFLEDYLREMPAVRVLADYREKGQATRSEQHPSATESRQHVSLSSRPSLDRIERLSSEITRAPRPLPQTPPQPPVHSPVPPDADSFTQQEKASTEHHKILTSLAEAAVACWMDRDSGDPCAVDLWARTPNGQCRVIFEAKTVTAENELIQTRHGFAQLFEYCVVYGEPTDRLCLVANQEFSSTRVRLLEKLGVAVLLWNGDDFVPGGSLWGAWQQSGLRDPVNTGS